MCDDAGDAISDAVEGVADIVSAGASSRVGCFFVLFILILLLLLVVVYYGGHSPPADATQEVGVVEGTPP